jgi:hypothetical protein
MGVAWHVAPALKVKKTWNSSLFRAQSVHASFFFPCDLKQKMSTLKSSKDTEKPKKKFKIFIGSKSKVKTGCFTCSNNLKAYMSRTLTI